MTAPGLPNYADYEFVFSAPDVRSGVMPGIELHRMILDALDSSRAELVESIAAGFDSLAAAAETFDRTGRDVDVVLAWQSAARYVRTHAAGRPTAAAAAVSSPTGTPPDTRAMPNGSELPGEHWNARLIREATERAATSPTGDPTDAR